MTQTYYKVLTADGNSPYQYVKWHLPDGDKPGKWMPRVEGELERCVHGYHGCTLEQLSRWIEENCRVFLMEYKGEVHNAGDKVIGHKARLLRECKGWDWKVYNKEVAPARKVYDEARAAAWKVYNEATAAAGKVYDEARAEIIKAMLA